MNELEEEGLRYDITLHIQTHVVRGQGVTDGRVSCWRERERGCCEVICIMWDGKLPSNVFVMLDPLPWPLPSDSGLNAFKCAGCSHSSRYLIHQFMTFYRPDPWWKCKHSHCKIKSTLGTSKSWLRVPTRKGGSSNTHGPRTALGSKLLTCVFIFVWAASSERLLSEISDIMKHGGHRPTPFWSPEVHSVPIAQLLTYFLPSCKVILFIYTSENCCFTSSDKRSEYPGVAEVLPDSSTIWLEQVPC